MALTNNDYWQALASRLGRQASGFPSALGSSVNRAFDRASTRAGQFGRAIGSAAQTFNRFPVDLGRSALGAAGAFGNALATGEDPYEPAGPPTELIQAPMPSFGDVNSAATTTAPPLPVAPPTVPPPVESPMVVQTGGSIRYRLPGGEWSEYKSGSVAPQVPNAGSAYDPIDRRAESYTPAAGGGTVSMMTAPENEGIVTEGSRMDDLSRQINERIARMTLADPNWQQSAKSGAKVDEALAIEQGKAQIQRNTQQQIMADIVQNDTAIDDGLAQQIREAQSNPQFARLAPEEQKRLIQEAQSEADEAKRAYRERVGMATGNVSVAMRPAAGPAFP